MTATHPSGPAPQRTQSHPHTGTKHFHNLWGAPAVPYGNPRTAGFVFVLALIIGAQIVICCTVVGLIGAALIHAGLTTFKQLLAPRAIAFVILLGGSVIAAIIAYGVNASLVYPIRQMTYAMGELARGNFAFKLQPAGRLRLREIDDFTTSFNATAQELASTELMRKEFVSDFSHEFRTPIASLCGFAELLRAENLTKDEQNEYLDIIIDEAHRLSRMSEDILALTRIEHTEILPDTTSIDVAQQLRQAAIMLGSACADRDIAIVVSGEGCTVEGNADYLMQLWSNLLGNAVKFSPTGRTVRAVLGVKRAEGALAKRHLDYACCRISDEGCGMDETTKAHIFDHFYQGDTSRSTEGNGIGLTLCKRVVELHGGTISVESACGVGTTFEVNLPLRRS